MRFREEGGAQRTREGLLGRAVGGVGVAQLCGSDVELKVDYTCCVSVCIYNDVYLLHCVLLREETDSCSVLSIQV